MSTLNTSLGLDRFAIGTAVDVFARFGGDETLATGAAGISPLGVGRRGADCGRCEDVSRLAGSTTGASCD